MFSLMMTAAVLFMIRRCNGCTELATCQREYGRLFCGLGAVLSVVGDEVLLERKM